MDELTAKQVAALRPSIMGRVTEPDVERFLAGAAAPDILGIEIRMARGGWILRGELPIYLEDYAQFRHGARLRDGEVLLPIEADPRAVVAELVDYETRRPRRRENVRERDTHTLAFSMP